MSYDELYGKVLDVSTGELFDRADLAQKLDGKRSIYIGELHPAQSHHDLQLDVLKNDFILADSIPVVTAGAQDGPRRYHRKIRPGIRIRVSPNEG